MRRGCTEGELRKAWGAAPAAGEGARAASMHEIVVTPDMLRESPLDADSDTRQATYSDTQEATHSDGRDAPECRADSALDCSDAVPAEKCSREAVSECQLATPAGSSLESNALGAEKPSSPEDGGGQGGQLGEGFCACDTRERRGHWQRALPV